MEESEQDQYQYFHASRSDYEFEPDHLFAFIGNNASQRRVAKGGIQNLLNTSQQRINQGNERSQRSHSNERSQRSHSLSSYIGSIELNDYVNDHIGVDIKQEPFPFKQLINGGSVLKQMKHTVLNQDTQNEQTMPINKNSFSHLVQPLLTCSTQPSPQDTSPYSTYIFPRSACFQNLNDFDSDNQFKEIKTSVSEAQFMKDKTRQSMLESGKQNDNKNEVIGCLQTHTNPNYNEFSSFGRENNEAKFPDAKIPCLGDSLLQQKQLLAQNEGSQSQKDVIDKLATMTCQNGAKDEENSSLSSVANSQPIFQTHRLRKRKPAVKVTPAATKKKQIAQKLIKISNSKSCSIKIPQKINSASKTIKKALKSKKQSLLPELQPKTHIPVRQSNIFVQRGRKREQDHSYISRIFEKIQEQKMYVNSLKQKENSQQERQKLRNKITAMEQRVKKKIEFRYMENVILNQNEKFKQLMDHIEWTLKKSIKDDQQVKEFTSHLDAFKFQEVYTDHDLWKQVEENQESDYSRSNNSKQQKPELVISLKQKQKKAKQNEILAKESNRSKDITHVLSQLVEQFIVKDEEMHIYPPNDEKQ